jgi:pimeloyl-ACP methyl ester carboxylesterase
MLAGKLALPNPRIEASTLVIWGERDFALAKECNGPLEKYVPQLNIHYLPAAGHWAQMDHPDEVNALLLNHLRASDPGATPQEA